MLRLEHKGVGDNFHKDFSNQMRDAVSLTAASLGENEQTRELLCPWCDGGNSHERSFSIRKVHHSRIEYRCWRAGCGQKGIIDAVGSLIGSEDTDQQLKLETKILNDSKPLNRKAYKGTFSEINQDGADYFMSKFGLTLDDLRFGEVSWDKESNRYIFPVHSQFMTVRGHALRTFQEDSTFTKWQAFPYYPDVTWMGWYHRPSVQVGPGHPIVIVEDAISALKVSRHFLCGYLNGTELDYDKISEISSCASRGNYSNGRWNHSSYRRVSFALDKDATDKAIKILQKFAFFFGFDAAAVPLEKDLKYSSDREIRLIFTGRE